MEELNLAAMVSSIGKNAQQVGLDYDRQQVAFELRQQAEERLLETVVGLARPALDAICNAIPGTELSGVVVANKKTSEGRPLQMFLLSDGAFLETWETWSVEENTTEMHAYLRTISYVVERYDVPKVVESIHIVVSKQVGKRKASTARAFESAEKVNAILTLLGVPKKAPEPADEIPF